MNEPEILPPLPKNQSPCNHKDCDQQAVASVTLKMWPKGHPKLDHNFMVIEMGLYLCSEHMGEVSRQGRSFFIYDEKNRAVIDGMIAKVNVPPIDWDTVETFGLLIDGSMIIDPNSCSPELPQESTDESQAPIFPN